MNRGQSVFHSYKLLVGKEEAEIDAQTAIKAHALGWCVEWVSLIGVAVIPNIKICLKLQAFFLVADDIMDHSKTRRGQPCWYLLVRILVDYRRDNW